MTDAAGGLLVRPFAASDFAACLAMFDGHVPESFAPEERAGFADFLNGGDGGGLAARYLVLTRGGRVVACGGFTIGGDGRAVLDWGMVAMSEQGQGLGARLLAERVALARNWVGLSGLRLATSQKSQGFYERAGFVVTAITPDGFGAGLDRIDLVLDF